MSFIRSEYFYAIQFLNYDGRWGECNSTFLETQFENYSQFDLDSSLKVLENIRNIFPDQSYRLVRMTMEVFV